MKNDKVKVMTYMAIFIALQIIATRFLSIDTPVLRIGLGFIPVIMAGMYLGPVKAGIIGAVADVVGMMLFPKGTFFPGFTVTAFLNGFITGFFLEGNRAKNKVNIVLSAIVSTLLVDTLFNTLNLVILIHGGQFDKYIPLMLTRLPNHLIMIVIKIVFTYVFYEALYKRVRLPGVEKKRVRLS